MSIFSFKLISLLLSQPWLVLKTINQSQGNNYLINRLMYKDSIVTKRIFNIKVEKACWGNDFENDILQEDNGLLA